MRNIFHVVLFPFAMLLGGLALNSSSLLKAEEAGELHVVTMTNMQFSGLPANANVGDRIIWINNDSVEHSATARDGRFDYRLKPGQKARTVLKNSGILRVDCIYHPTMRGVVKISG